MNVYSSYAFPAVQNEKARIVFEKKISVELANLVVLNSPSRHHSVLNFLNIIQILQETLYLYIHCGCFLSEHTCSVSQKCQFSSHV